MLIFFYQKNVFLFAPLSTYNSLLTSLSQTLLVNPQIATQFVLCLRNAKQFLHPLIFHLSTIVLTVLFLFYHLKIGKFQKSLEGTQFLLQLLYVSVNYFYVVQSRKSFTCLEEIKD